MARESPSDCTLSPSCPGANDRQSSEVDHVTPAERGAEDRASSARISDTAPFSPDSFHSFNSEKPFAFEHHDHVPLSQRVGDELLRLSQMAGPLFLQNAFSYSTSVIAVAFVGHLGDASLLSCAVLANSLYNVSGYSIISGLSAGMETLCGQAYGARSYKTLGLVLQRALLITWLVCLPISVLWAHAEPLLLALGQQPRIAQGAASYLWHITPTLFMAALVECLKRYLLAQRVVVPGMIITIISCCLSPLYNWLLIFKCQLALSGAAYAFVLSQGTSCLLLLAYTIWRDAAMAASGDEKATWSRPGIATFQGWGKYLSYGLNSTIMVCMEWWAYEVVIFLSGIAHNAEVAVGVMGLCFQISAMAYMSAMAYGSSVNTRIGNELGSGNAAAARLAVNTGLVAVVVVQTGWALLCLLWARQVVGLLTNNPAVVDLTLQVLPILLPTFVSDAINCVCMGVLRGAGRPGIGAVMNIVGYWVVGVPLSYLFGIRMHMSVKGFWLGLLCTSGGQSIVQMLVISCFNWDREVERAAVLMAEHEQEAADIKAAMLGAAVTQQQPAGAPEGAVSDTTQDRDRNVDQEGEQTSLLGGRSSSHGLRVQPGLSHSSAKPLSPRTSGSSSSSTAGSSSSSTAGQQGRSRLGLPGLGAGSQQQGQDQGIGSSSRGARVWWQFWSRARGGSEQASSQPGQQQQQHAAAVGGMSGSEQSPLLVGTQQQQQQPNQQRTIQPQVSLQRALLQSCDSIDRS